MRWQARAASQCAAAALAAALLQSRYRFSLGEHARELRFLRAQGGHHLASHQLPLIGFSIDRSSVRDVTCKALRL